MMMKTLQFITIILFFQANHRIQLCQKHPKETLRLYCETTNECVCRDCTLTEYKNMKVELEIH